MNNKIFAIIQSFVRDTKSILKDNLIEEYLFGSYAQKRNTADSDIDILIIVKSLSPKIRSRISSLSSEYSLQKDVCISPILKEVEIWEKNRKYSTLFFQEITQNGIKL